MQISVVSIEKVIDLYQYIYGNHEKANTIDQDGKVCVECGLPIPLQVRLYRSHNTGKCYVKVDRSNRVDVNLHVTAHGKQWTAYELVSYHINCWKSLVFK